MTNFKSKFYSLLIVFITTLSGVGLAQTTSNEVNQQNISDLGESAAPGSIRLFDGRYDGVRGTPLLFEEPQLSTITFKDNSQLERVPLNIDVVNNQIFINYNAKIIRMNAKRVQKITILNTRRVFVNSKNQDLAIEKNPYVELLAEGEVSLYALYSKRFTKADYQGAYSSGQSYDSYSEGPTLYYLKDKNGEIKSFKLKKGQILQLFDAEADKVKAVVKKYKVDLKKKEGLIALVRLHNNGEF